MDTILINSENSKNSEYPVSVLKLADKLDPRREYRIENRTTNLSIYYTWNNK